MSRYALKFPRRVRIHGGEFDESARAIHREDGLKTIQAESGIVLGSTIERKQMSTKTTFKRVALVAVAALGFGVMSVAPSSAAINSQALYHSTDPVGSNYADNSSITQRILLTASAVLGLQHSFVASQAGDTATVTASLDVNVSNYYNNQNNPNSALPVLTTGAYATHNTGAAVNATQVVDQVAGTVSTISAAAGAVVGSLKSTFTPTQAGTYTLSYKITNETFTQTVVVYATQAELDAANGVDNVLSTAKTTSILTSGEAVTAVTDDTVTKSMALSGTSAGTIKVTPLNAAGNAIPTQTISVVVTGPGTVAIGTTDTAVHNASVGTGRAVSLSNGYYIAVFADGTPGVSTITISVGTTVIGVETVTFYGAAASITPTVVQGILDFQTAATGAITAVVKDAAGVVVANQAVTAASGTVATIANTGIACGNTNTSGVTSCNLTGLAAGTSAITLTAGAAVSTPVTVRVSDGTATTVAYTFDKATYAPGESAKITATVSNAAGLMPTRAAGYNMSGAVTGNYALGGTAMTGTVIPAGDTGQLVYNVVMPTGVSGTLSLLVASPVAGKTITTGTADVVNEALDAALEAIDAAENARLASEAAIEAATDAQAAAEDAITAAENAQAAAEDATAAAVQAGVDAVAAADAAGAAAVAAVAEAVAATEEASAAAVEAAEKAGADAIEAAEQAGADAVAATELAVAAADAATAAADEAALAATEAGEMAVAAAEAAGLIAQDALDAAIEATQAATDALDAANEAKASADAATEAAKAAVAAVEALSTKVATLMAGINAKINSLSTLLAKIAKKVGVK